MFDMKAETLRDLLRAGTAQAHQRLDTGVTALDVATLKGLTAFLAMNARSFRALDAAGLRGVRVTPELLRDLADACEADLASLGVAPDAGAARVAIGGQIAPEALDYVVLGSRLGTRVLARRWASSPDADVRAAGAYFARPDHLADWRALAADLSERSADDREATRLVEDANRLFDLFQRAFGASQDVTCHV